MCVKAQQCWLKNMFFRADEDFYRELDAALEPVRKREVRWFGTPRQVMRRAEMFVSSHPRARALYDRLHNGSRPLRHWAGKRVHAVREALSRKELTRQE